ncbi:MAG: Fic family protein [Oscillospiraceae bacterium]|nr:Fic family protein [Oscillospiraceae bacterium]
MARKTLKTLFHMGSGIYKEEYQHRFQDEDTLHLPVMIGENQAFICQTPEVYRKIIAIERTDKKINTLSASLPGIAINQFAERCLIDEILLTNNIEGVHSTRKEIGEILQDLSANSKRDRFVGLVTKYYTLMQGKKLMFQTCQDIRKVYDDIFYEEIKAAAPDHLPDGQIFRKDGVEVQSPAQKILHKGLYPESKIIQTMEQSLSVLNQDSIDIFIRIAIFHYLFGYIHPFYDGNGRTSRFISSYLLSEQLNPLIGFRLSYTIKENISKYYEAFRICNDAHNKGELTPFAETFLEIVSISMEQLWKTLSEKKLKLEYYYHLIPNLPNAEQKSVSELYDLLIQAALFSNIGIGREELIKVMSLSENTVRSKLKAIPQQLLIQNIQKGKKYYLLNLEETDKLFEQDD